VFKLDTSKATFYAKTAICKRVSDKMTWEVFSIIGTIAFAISGAIVAMEEEYDILGVYILGIVTAFGGGAVRNLLIGVPISALWDQGMLFQVALVAMTAVFLFPKIGRASCRERV